MVILEKSEMIIYIFILEAEELSLQNQYYKSNSFNSMKNLKPKHILYCFLIFSAFSSFLFVSCNKQKSEVPTDLKEQDFITKEIQAEYLQIKPSSK